MDDFVNDGWFECEPYGQCGYFFYHQGIHEIPFSWEISGGGVVMTVGVVNPEKFVLQFPWAADRQLEILERVASELIRQQAPGCVAEIDVRSMCIQLREK